MRDNLIALRKKRKLTQQQMAERLNIARTTYTGYENANFSPSIEKAIKIKRILGTTNDNIFLVFNDRKTDKKLNKQKKEVK